MRSDAACAHFRIRGSNYIFQDRPAKYCRDHKPLFFPAVLQVGGKVFGAMHIGSSTNHKFCHLPIGSETTGLQTVGEGILMSRFDHIYIRTETRLLVQSTCKTCRVSRLVTVNDGSLYKWENGHACEDASPASVKISLTR